MYTLAERRNVLENTPPEIICTLRPEGRGGRIFQFIATRGSVLTFFFLVRECIGNYTQNSQVVLTIYNFNTLLLYKKRMTYAHLKTLFMRSMATVDVGQWSNDNAQRC